MGFLYSLDSGAAWNQLHSSLKNKLITFFDISSDASRIVAVERDAFKIYKSDDSGRSFTAISVDVNRSIKISPVDKDLILYVSNGKLYRSSDGLATTDNNGQPVLSASNNINDIEFAPSNPTIVYAAEVGYNLWKSTDSGRTFLLMGNLRKNVMSRHVSLSLNSKSFHPGSRLSLSANTSSLNTLISAVDAYVSVQLPNGTDLYLQPGGISLNKAPLVRGWTVKEFAGSIFTHTFEGSEPTGSYTWSAFFTNPGTQNVVGTAASATFEFSP